MSAPTTTDGRRRLLRPTAFRIGLLAGGAAFLVTAWLLSALVDWFEGPELEHNVQVASSGEAMTRYGARRLEIHANRALLMRQVCNEACDDLSYGSHDGAGLSYVVAVLDARGRCLSCDNSLYVDDIGDSIARFEVRGEGNLWVRSGYFERQPDGSLKPTTPGPPPKAPPTP